MIDIGVQCSLEQLLEHGFFHADPHPGNLLALEDGRLCYLDFGMMSEVSRESRSGLIQAVVHLVNKNFDKLSQDFVKLGFLSEEVNLEPIVPAFQDVFINAVEQGVSKMDFKSVTDDMSGVMYKFPFRLPPYYALIIRSLLTLEGIALSVDPNFKILGAAYPYFARRLMEDPDPQLRESLKEMLFDDKKFKWDRLEDLLSNAAKQTNLDLEKLLDEVINLLFSPKGGFLRNEIVEGLTNQIDLLSLKILKSLNNYLPKSIKLNTINENNNLSDLIMYVEPLRKLFKDEVRKVGASLGLPDEIIKRHPFPGPGLAIRILGEVNNEKLDCLRDADWIVRDEIKKAGLYNDIWQAFAVLLPVKTVGVMGDKRTYAWPIVLRCVSSEDGMTADWSKIPFQILERISNRIVNEVSTVNRVVYDITSKPPGTIEWE